MYTSSNRISAISVAVFSVTILLMLAAAVAVTANYAAYGDIPIFVIKI